MEIESDNSKDDLKTLTEQIFIFKKVSYKSNVLITQGYNKDKRLSYVIDQTNNIINYEQKMLQLYGDK